MKVSWNNSKYALRATVYPFSDFKSSIDIERHRPFGAKEGETWPEAQINLPSIGSINREETEVFSVGLLEAVKIAKEMDRDIRIGEALFEIRGEEVRAEFACTRREQIEETIKEEGGTLVDLWKWKML